MAAFVLPAISALAGLFGNRKQTQEKTNETTTNMLSSPELSQNQNTLSDAFTRALIDRFNTDPDLKGYTAGGLDQINEAADARAKITNNILASRGLSYSPAATVGQINNENQRLSGGVDFLNTIPLLARQLKGQDIQGLIQGFSALPTATRTTGTTKQKGTDITPSNMVGGALGGLGAGLAAPINRNADGSVDSSLSMILKRFF